MIEMVACSLSSVMRVGLETWLARPPSARARRTPVSWSGLRTRLVRCSRRRLPRIWGASRPKTELRLRMHAQIGAVLAERGGPIDAGAFGGTAVDAEDLGFDDDLALGLVDAVEEFAGLFDAVGGVDDDDGVGLGLEVDDAGAGAEHGFDEFLDLLHVGGAEVAELIVELGAGQLGELGLGEGVDGVALGVQGESVHEGEFLHLLEGIAVVEVTGDEEFRTGDLGVVEILASGGFGEELEDVIESGILDDESFVGFLHFLLLVLRAGRRGAVRCRRAGVGGWTGRGGSGSRDGGRQSGRRLVRRCRQRGRRVDRRRRRRTPGSAAASATGSIRASGRVLGVEQSGDAGCGGEGDELAGFHGGGGLADVLGWRSKGVSSHRVRAGRWGCPEPCRGR